MSSGEQVSICAAHHAAEPAGGVLVGQVDQPARAVESLAARLHIPGVVEQVAVPREPARVAEHRRGDRADAGLGERIDPALEGGEMSTTVVTPLISSSASATRIAATEPSGRC